MKKVYLVVGLVVIVILTAVVLGRVSERRSAVVPSGKLKVAATIFPVADIARHVAGSEAEVVLIIPPGVSEHSNDLAPQQLIDLQGSQIIFKIGHGVDDRLTQRLEAVVPAAVATVDRGITLQNFEAHHTLEIGPADGESEHQDTGVDPHYWLTVPNAQQIATNIASVLATTDPAHATLYQENLKQYHQELDTLETELQQIAATATHKEFIAMHNAWSYFAPHYGFTLVATYEPVEGQEPSLAELGQLRQLITEHHLATFFAEPQKASSNVTRLMRDELGLEISVLDPVGGLGKMTSYSALMRENIMAVSHAR